METFISILEGILFIVKVAFSISIVVLIACLGVWASDEYKEVRAERSLELARAGNEDSLFTSMVEETRVYRARHAYDKSQKQYRHEVTPAAPSYLEQTREKTRKVLPFGDEDFFAALLKEQEMVHAW